MAILMLVASSLLLQVEARLTILLMRIPISLLSDGWTMVWFNLFHHFLETAMGTQLNGRVRKRRRRLMFLVFRLCMNSEDEIPRTWF